MTRVVMPFLRGKKAIDWEENLHHISYDGGVTWFEPKTLLIREENKMRLLPTIENIATLFITGATLVGLYALGAGWFSLFSLLFMTNLNMPRQKDK